MLRNDYRHASPPARSESWGVVDVQVDFTGLAIIRPHRSSQNRVHQRTLLVSIALSSLDLRWGRSIRAIVMSSLKYSSISMTSCGRVGLSLTGHSCLAPYCCLVHMRPCRRQLAATSHDRSEVRSANGSLNQRSRERQQLSPLRLRFRSNQVGWI